MRQGPRGLGSHRQAGGHCLLGPHTWVRRMGLPSLYRLPAGPALQGVDGVLGVPHMPWEWDAAGVMAREGPLQMCWGRPPPESPSPLPAAARPPPGWSRVYPIRPEPRPFATCLRPWSHSHQAPPTSQAPVPVTRTTPRPPGSSRVLSRWAVCRLSGSHGPLPRPRPEGLTLPVRPVLRCN